MKKSKLWRCSMLIFIVRRKFTHECFLWFKTINQLFDGFVDVRTHNYTAKMILQTEWRTRWANSIAKQFTFVISREVIWERNILFTPRPLMHATKRSNILADDESPKSSDQKNGYSQSKDALVRQGSSWLPPWKVPSTCERNTVHRFSPAFMFPPQPRVEQTTFLKMPLEFVTYTDIKSPKIGWLM